MSTGKLNSKINSNNLVKEIRAREIIIILLAPLGVIAGAIVTAPLPEIYEAFEHIENASLLVKFILTSTSIGVAVSAPATGYIMDKSGRKKLLVISLIVYGISGSSGYVLKSLYMILVFRFLLGISISGIMTAATALIADYYDGEIRSKMMGFTAVNGISYNIIKYCTLSTSRY